MPSKLEYSIIDSFARSPFKGNPAAVTIVPPELPDATLQSIAAEFNLSETAFITVIDASKGKFGLRWFTPAVEVPLCGHGTLASAHVLSQSDILPKGIDTLEFETKFSGILTAKTLEDGRIELEFPAGEPSSVPEEVEKKVKEAFGKAFSESTPKIVDIAEGSGPAYGGFIVIEVEEGHDLAKAVVKSEAFVSPMVLLARYF